VLLAFSFRVDSRQAQILPEFTLEQIVFVWFADIEMLSYASDNGMRHPCQFVDFFNSDCINLVVQVETGFVLTIALNHIH
jgi:hypothetical protein